MDKRELAKALTDHANGHFINQAQLAKFMRKSKNSMPDLLRGLEFLQSGREKKYFVGDVAGRIKEEARM